MAWEVVGTDEFAAFYQTLPESSRDRVDAAVDALAEEGPELGRPLVDRIHRSTIHNLKELRPLQARNKRFGSSSSSTQLAPRSSCSAGTRQRTVAGAAGIEQQFRRPSASTPTISSKQSKVTEMGTRKWADIKASVPQTPEREARVAQARAELNAEVRSYNLTELRRLVSTVTQGDLAEALAIKQSAISKTERADDMTVRRLRTTVEALGGTLTLVATFDDKPVVLVLGRTNRSNPPGWMAAAQRWATEADARTA